eukprot:snap_masked-scaffold_46-processed-gene-1.33-mRNA-1 protein AED:1.00 eAED:1.00 QI:0/0/0/0/1/1/2/0/74
MAQEYQQTFYLSMHRFRRINKCGVLSINVLNLLILNVLALVKSFSKFWSNPYISEDCITVIITSLSAFFRQISI